MQSALGGQPQPLVHYAQVDRQYSSQRGTAYLNVIDVHSGQVWANLPPVEVDGGESWTLVWWYLQAQEIIVTGRLLAQATGTIDFLTARRCKIHAAH